MSLRARLLNIYLRFVVKRRLASIQNVDKKTAEIHRASLLRASKIAIRPVKPVQVSPVATSLVRGDWLHTPASKPQPVGLYLHGGGFVMGAPRVYWDLGSRLALAAQARVFVPAYRLAPEHPYPAALDDAFAAWQWLTQQAPSGPRFIAGDSAGGCLALSLLLRLRDLGHPLPNRVVLLSPWTDLSASHASLQTNEHLDPMLVPSLVGPVAALYRGNYAAEDPQLSPVFADLGGLPPMCVHVGSTEILYDDAERLVHNAKAQGVTAQLKVWPDMPHVFQLFARLIPEGRRSLDELGEFCRE